MAGASHTQPPGPRAHWCPGGGGGGARSGCGNPGWHRPPSLGAGWPTSPSGSSLFNLWYGLNSRTLPPTCPNPKGSAWTLNLHTSSSPALSHSAKQAWGQRVESLACSGGRRGRRPCSLRLHGYTGYTCWGPAGGGGLAGGAAFSPARTKVFRAPGAAVVSTARKSPTPCRVELPSD